MGFNDIENRLSASRRPLVYRWPQAGSEVTLDIQIFRYSDDVIVLTQATANEAVHLMGHHCTQSQIIVATTSVSWLSSDHLDRGNNVFWLWGVSVRRRARAPHQLWYQSESIGRDNRWSSQEAPQVLTRTGYPAFLCSKDVWVILLISVSILIPLRDNELLDYF